MSHFRIIYDSNRYVRSLARTLGFGYSCPSEVKNSRFVEYSWVLRNLDVSSLGRILDVGSTGSTFPILLASFGYDVYSIDVREYDWKPPQNVTFILGDIRHSKFQKGFFDGVTAVSTIEHVGLGRYGDPQDTEGDIRALTEIARILKSGGKLLITIPFGEKAVTRLGRVYDSKDLTLLLEGFQIENVEFFGFEDGYWFICQGLDLANVKSSKKEAKLACIKASKI